MARAGYRIRAWWGRISTLSIDNIPVVCSLRIQHSVAFYPVKSKDLTPNPLNIEFSIKISFAEGADNQTRL